MQQVLLSLAENVYLSLHNLYCIFIISDINEQLNQISEYTIQRSDSFPGLVYVFSTQSVIIKNWMMLLY